MRTPKLTETNAAKVRFFTFFSVSILLVLVLFASFAKGSKTIVDRRTGTATVVNADSRVQVDELLHQRMEKLQNVRATYAGKENTAGAEEMIMAEKAAFLAVVDSIRKATASLSDERAKAQINALLNTFSRDAEKGILVVKGSSNPTNAAPDGKAAAELADLKAILVQKEQRIQQLEKNAATPQQNDQAVAALQTRINQLQDALARQPKTAPQTASKNDGAAAEWKEKYARLKESSEKQKETIDKYVSQANALKTSYKEVIEDNKRLLTQLQSVRAAKN